MRILRVLLVDDDTEFLGFAEKTLSGARYTVTTSSDFESAASILRGHKGKMVILSDLTVGRGYVLPFLKDTAKLYPYTPFTVLAHSPPLESVIEALKQGAYDFLRKPVAPDILCHSVGRSAEKLNLSLETEKQEKEMRELLSRSREELKRSRMLEEFKGFMISTAAHDFRSILTVLDGYHQILKEKCGGCDDSESAPILEQALRSISRLRMMTSTLFDYEAAEKGELTISPRSFELGSLLRDCISFYRPYAQQKKLTLELEGIPFPLKAKGDPDRVMQILDNLLYNSIKFTPARGEILVGARTGDEGYTTVWVRDTGLGISRAVLRKILEMEELPEKKDGDSRFGLGLRICRKLIEVQNGKIWIESSPGKGTVVSFSLPGQ